MTGNEYQRLAMRTATSKCRDMANAALGLTGEAGEVADEIKKFLFHGHPLNPEKVVKELGDVLWYVALMADLLNVSLDFVMEHNIEKLKRRYPDGFDPVRSINREENNGKMKTQTVCDCDSCRYCDECTTDDMASCAHGANMSCGSDYQPKNNGGLEMNELKSYPF